MWFSHETKKCLRSRGWVIVHLMISSFSSRKHFFPFNLKVVWKYFRNFNVIGKVFFLFADTSTANIPWSKSLHKFNHRSQMDFNSEWITWSKLWRCQHSLIASFSQRDSKIQFLRVHGSPFVVGRLQFSLQKERKEENVCTDLKSSFLYLSPGVSAEWKAGKQFLCRQLLKRLLLLSWQTKRWMGELKRV